jgi:hypothetical protein
VKKLQEIKDKVSKSNQLTPFSLNEVNLLLKEIDRLEIENKASDELIDEKQNTINNLLEQLNA